jgi:putative membrane protein
LSGDAEPVASTEGMRLNFLGLFIGFITGLPRLFFPLIAAFFGARRIDNSDAFLPIIIGAVIGLSLFVRWLRWTRFRYYTGAEEIRIESGLISRTARSIPYERIQDVSIEQKPMARLFGLGEVKFETGAGAGDEGALSYVSIYEAERLRELVRARKAGVGDDPVPAAIPDAAPPPIFAMDMRRVLTLGFYSFSLVIFAVLGGAAQQLDFLLPFDLYDVRAWLGMAKDNGSVLNGIGWTARIYGAVIALLMLIAIGIATGMIRTLLREYGFRLEFTPKGFRRRRGLLTLTDTIMPIHRVQAVNIETGPVRKLRGWYALKFVSLANDTATKKGQDNDHAAAPLATMAEIERILQAAGIDCADTRLQFARGDAGWWIIQMIITALLSSLAMAVLALTTAAEWRTSLLLLIPALAAVTFYFQWRNNRYALDADQLFVRRGWWRERLTIAPQIKVQSAEIRQGPLARMRGLASLQLGIAGGSLQVIALPVAVAHRIRAQIIAAAISVDYSRITMH